MMTQPENSNQDVPENKPKTQKRKQKDEKSAETVKSKEDMPISERIVPIFPSQNKRQKNVKPPKSKTDSKNSVTKKVPKKVNKKSKKTEESANINGSVSGETLGNNESTVAAAAMVDSETASLDSEQTGEEQLPEITNAQSSNCKPQSQNDNKDGDIVCKDGATLENNDNSTNKPKDLNDSEMPPEKSSIVEEVTVAQIPLESDLKNSGIKPKNKNEDSEKFDEKRIVPSDTEHGESSEEQKLTTDNSKERTESTMTNKQQSSQNDEKFNPKYSQPSQEPKAMTDNHEKSDDQTVSNKKIMVSSEAECEEPSEEPKTTIDNCKQSSDDQPRNNKQNSTKNDIKSNPLYCQPSQDSRVKSDNCKESNDQSCSNKQNCSQNDVKSNPKYCEPSEEPRIISDNFKRSHDQISNKQNSSQNDIKSNLLSEFGASQTISKQNSLIQDQSSLTDSSQTVLIQAENSNEYKVNENDHSKNSDQVTNSNNEHLDELQPAIKSINEFIGLIEGIPKMKDITPIKPPILTAAVEEKDKNHSVPKSCKKQVSEISCFSGAQIKDTLIYENEDMDISDSQLCATEWNGDSSPENKKSKKTDCSLAQFKKAEKEGTQIVNELINELSRLNKLLLHYKREIDSVWKRRKISPATIQQNVIKKRAPVQTLMGQFR